MRAAAIAETRAQLPVASLAETAGIVAGVLGPTLAKGVIIRRPWMVALPGTLNNYALRFAIET